MAIVNSGFETLHCPDAGGPVRGIVAVLGLPRGGTTMTAALLEAAGVFMGENLPFTREDEEIAQLLRERVLDRKAFDAVVSARSRGFPIWGFKAPYRYHWDALRTLPDARFVVVYRDVLAVAKRNQISAEADIAGSLLANSRTTTRITDFVLGAGRPAFLFSYEKAVLQPRPICAGLARFVGNPDPAAVDAMVGAVQANEPGYLAAAAPRASGCTGIIDGVAGAAAVGWVRSESGPPMPRVVITNGTLVLGAGRPDIVRPDLVREFGETARGFSIALPAGAVAPGTVLSLRLESDGYLIAQYRHPD